jgi:hypothetical protein
MVGDHLLSSFIHRIFALSASAALSSFLRFVYFLQEAHLLCANHSPDERQTATKRRERQRAPRKLSAVATLTALSLRRLLCICVCVTGALCVDHWWAQRGARPTRTAVFVQLLNNWSLPTNSIANHTKVASKKKKKIEHSFLVPST